MKTRLAKRVVLLAITAVSIYLIIPSIIATFSSWPELAKLRDLCDSALTEGKQGDVLRTA